MELAFLTNHKIIVAEKEHIIPINKNTPISHFIKLVWHFYCITKTIKYQDNFIKNRHF